jgi:hypothetical protein
LIERGKRSLRRGVVRAHGFDDVADELETHGLRFSRRYRSPRRRRGHQNSPCSSTGSSGRNPARREDGRRAPAARSRIRARNREARAAMLSGLAHLRQQRAGRGDHQTRRARRQAVQRAGSRRGDLASAASGREYGSTPARETAARARTRRGQTRPAVDARNRQASAVTCSTSASVRRQARRGLLREAAA